MKLVVIAGGTASGKTTAAQIAASRLSEALLIHHDRYYRDIPNPRGFNFDHPDALDTDGACAPATPPSCPSTTSPGTPAPPTPSGWRPAPS